MARHTGAASGTETSAAGRQTQRRSVNVTLWVLQVLAAAIFAFSGLSKVLREPQTVAGFETIGWGDWFMYLIGALEIAGAVGLLIPAICGIAGLAFVGLMVGAIIMTQVYMGGGALLAVPAGTLVVVTVIAYGRRHRSVEFIRLIGRRTAQ